MFQALLGPLLSFGSSLLSGFGAQQSAKKQQKLQQAYEYQAWQVRQNVASEILGKYDFKNIPVHAAEAGFNPVTYLGALGGSYGAMHQMAYSFKGQAQAAPTVQVPSGLEVFGGALSAGVGTYLADERVRQSQDFQRQMLQTQISAIQRNGGKPLKLASAVPAANTTFFGSGSIPYSVTAGAAVSSGFRTPAQVMGLTEWKPQEVPPTDPRTPYMEPGRGPEVGLMPTFGGGFAVGMSEYAKDRLEEDPAGVFAWTVRNRLSPIFGEQHGSLEPAGWGWKWEFSPFLQEYRREYRPAWDQNYTDPGHRRRLESPRMTNPEGFGPFQDWSQRGLPWAGGDPISGSGFPFLNLKPIGGNRGW